MAHAAQVRAARPARAGGRAQSRPEVVWGHYLVPTGTIARRAAKAAGRAVRADRPRHGRRERRALAAHPRGDREGRRPVPARSSRCPRISAARLDAVAGPLGERRAHRQRGRRHAMRSATATRPSPRRALGWESDGPRVVSVANYIERKNLPRLRRGVRRRAHGVGRRLARARRRRPAAGRARGARRAGWASPRACASCCDAPPVEVPRWLRACDVACLVSTVEGFGLAPIEALACGRPVVVSREVPSGAAVTEGRHGRGLRLPPTCAGMAAALQRAARSRPARRRAPRLCRMRSRARRSASSGCCRRASTAVNGGMRFS